MAIDAYPETAFDLGRLADGRTVRLAPMTADAARDLGTRTATFGPWLTYGFSADVMTASFMPPQTGCTLYQASVDGTRAGALCIRSPWLIGPYLRTLAVLPEVQGTGLGAALLAWFEARAKLSGARNAWLCVAGFNEDAQRFYRRHGWTDTADLPDLMTDGILEKLMRKRLD